MVDLRVGSPTFQRWEAVELDDAGGRALFLAEGLGHAFTPLSDEATVVYLCSTGYAPDAEHGVHPLDPDIGIAWPDGAEAVLSGKDAAAPGLAEALRTGLLPSYEACLARARALRGSGRPRRARRGPARRPRCRWAPGPPWPMRHASTLHCGRAAGRG